MAVPKRKTTRSKRNKRRANHRITKAPDLSECSHCHQLKLPHKVCPHCGFYKGKEIVEAESS